jgi:hypothetical protein
MVVPADRGGCGYYRCIWPAQAVSQVRPDWTVSIVQPEKIQAGFVDGKFVGVKGFPDPLPDLLVMQRVGTPGQLEVMRWASQNGVATVLDFDDAMWCIDKNNAAWKSWNMANPHNQHWKICETAAQIADLVTVTTDALASHYGKKHRRTEVLPNCIPLATTQLALPEENEIFTAGWAGYTQTHPNDCKVSAPAAKAVLEQGGALRVVADARGAAAEWGIGPAHVDSVPPQKLGPDYYSALARLDLMLVGLQDTPFNRSKSALKVLEAAAMGVPSIAPNNPPHRVLAKTGFPVLLASTPTEWADAAKEIKHRWDTGSPLEIREEMTSAVQEGHTIEGNAERWAQAWERAMKRKHG